MKYQRLYLTIGTLILRYHNVCEFNPNIVNNQFVEGNVIVGSDSVYSLPETSFIKLANDNYILKLENESDSSYFFSKIKVQTGIKNQGYIELKDTPLMKPILVNGTYNLKID